jgi:DNA-binding beta-propeller fold protein YncE
MNFRRLAFAVLFLAVFAHPCDLWAKKHHHTPTPTETPTDTATPTPTLTPTAVPYTGPKLYTFDAMWGSKGANPDQLNDPEAIDISPSGKMVIADTGNNRIVVWDANGKPVTAFGTFGSRADWRNPPQFNHPSGVFVHPASRKLYVADTLNQRVVVLDEHGLVLTSWGAQGQDNGNFNLPRTIDKDHFGNVWVLDSGNSRVEIFSQLGQFNSTWGAFGDPSSNSNNAMMNVPLGMAINNIDQALVADTGNFKLQVFNDGGVPVTNVGWYGGGPYQFKEPGDVAIVNAKDGLIAVTDGTTGRVEFFNHRFEPIGQWSARDDILNDNYHPHFRGIAADSQGRLYITDIRNNAIVRIKPIKAPEIVDTPPPSPPTPTPPVTAPYSSGFPIR